MHIKTGSWESSSAVCESDLCDPAVLEPQIRNRRLSPGSGSGGGGGGGGGCVPSHAHLRQGQRATAAAPPSSRKPPRRSRSSRRERKQRWAEQSGLSLLRAPPAFPVQDSPAKLQPAVTYASKVKGGLEVLLQNQWGLSFISEARPVPESPAPSPPEATPVALPRPLEEEQENNSKLLLSCRHLVDALSYHRREWESLFSRENKESRTVLWLETFQKENPA